MSAYGWFSSARLSPAIDELEESFFIGIGNRDELVGDLDPAAFDGFDLAYRDHK